MNRIAIWILIIPAIVTSADAQQPVPLFSAEQIKSFTPADNPITDAKVKLGDMIFDEKRVSSDNSVACNTCHSPRNGLTTHTETSRGAGDQLGKPTRLRFRTPCSINRCSGTGAPPLSKSRPPCRF